MYARNPLRQYQKVYPCLLLYFRDLRCVHVILTMFRHKFMKEWLQNSSGYSAHYETDLLSTIETNKYIFSQCALGTVAGRSILHPKRKDMLL